MANPFLNKTDLVDRDVETALLLEKAKRLDIGNAVAYTDGDKVFLNTEDNLFNILPAYDQRMLKWLLWHEQMHMHLKHHNRFFKYLDELNEEDTMDKFKVTKDEVNIIMDILVHDWMADKFPELVETALTNLAQMRNRNSLTYTFKTYTLEEMLTEYAEHKKEDKKEDKKSSKSKETEDKKEDESTDEPKEDESTSEPKEKPKETPKEESKDKDKKGGKTSTKKGHSAGGGSDEESKEKSEETGAVTHELPPEHEKTDWSKLKDLDDKEFITKSESDRYERQIEELKRKKLRLARLTETLNGLATSTRKRSYAMPSTVYIGGGVILKGSTPGRAKLYLCFDASGSMSGEMRLFKEIISKSIPQAMETPTTWFSGCYAKIKPKEGMRSKDYYKGTFKDFMPVYADNGYSDDGDRTIELCWKAEQEGYSPIGITDGGGRLSWSKKQLKELRRTIIVSQNEDWTKEVKAVNPAIQVINI